MQSVQAAIQASSTPDSAHAPVSEHARHARRVLFGALGIGIMGDQLLRSGPVGIGGAVWVLFAITTLASLTRPENSPSLFQRRLLLGVSSAIALLLALREAPALTILTLGSLLALAALATAYFRGDMIDDLRNLPILHSAHAALRAYLAGAVGAIMLLLRDLRADELASTQMKHRAALLRGLVITIPVAAVFIGLFAAADPTFEAFADTLQIDIGELLGHIVLTGILTWIAAGVLRHAALGEDAPVIRPRTIEAIGALEVAMLLGTMILVFTIFVALQLPRMFAGEEYIIRETGLTYAGYARRGFFELVAASTLTLVLIAGLRTVVQLEERAQRMLRMLGGVLVALVFVILQSAVHRLALYVNAYGWTEDRIYAIAIVTWLALCFSLSFATLLGRAPQRFLGGAIAAGVLVLFGLAAVNPQATIVHLNADRARAGHTFDLGYVGRELGSDAVPAVARELERMPANIVLSAEDCSGLSQLLYRLDRGPDWRAWTLSAWRARSAVDSIETWRAKHCSRGVKPARVASR